MKEIKNYPPINQSYEVVSQFGESKNNVAETNNEDFNIENNIYNNEMPRVNFLKLINSKNKYILVLDLNETLVHYISE